MPASSDAEDTPAWRSSARLAELETRKRDRALRRQRIRMLLEGDPEKSRALQESNPELVASPQEMEFVCNLRTKQLKNILHQQQQQQQHERGSNPLERCNSSSRLTRGTILMRSQSLGPAAGVPWDSDDDTCGAPTLSNTSTREHPVFAKSRSLREGPACPHEPDHNGTRSSPIRNNTQGSNCGSPHSSPQRWGPRVPRSRSLREDTFRSPLGIPLGGVTSHTESDDLPRGQPPISYSGPDLNSGSRRSKISSLARSQSVDPRIGGWGQRPDLGCEEKPAQPAKPLHAGSPAVSGVRCPAPRIPRSGTLELCRSRSGRPTLSADQRC